MLLGWHQPPYWRATDGVMQPEDRSPIERRLDERQWQWLEQVLERAEPLPDRNHAPSLGRRATLASGGTLALEDLAKSVRRRGSRVAFIGPRDIQIGYEPGILVPMDGLPPEAVDLLRGPSFHNRWEHDGEMMLAIPRFYETEEIAALLCVMVRRAPDQLRRAWGLAVALELVPLFIDALSPASRHTLVEELLEELLVDVDDLSCDADLELQTDLSDRATLDDRPHPDDRSLAAMFKVEWWMRFLERDLLEGHHYRLAETIMHAGSAKQVGHCLSTLPPGKTLEEALMWVVSHRPALLANLVADTTSRCVGVYGLTRLPTRSGRGLGVVSDLSKEWRRTQVLARCVLVGPSTNADDVCDLLLHDEADVPRSLDDSHVPMNELWRDALAALIANAPLLDAVASRLEQDLRADGPPQTSTYAATMRLSRALRAETSDDRSKVASRLALGWAEAYLRHARDPGHPHVPQVENLGEQLEGLAGLPQDEPQTWGELIKALNPRDLHRLAQGDRSRTISSEHFNPTFDGPRLIEGHAANLVAIARALAVQAPRAARDLLDASLEMMTRVHGWLWSPPLFSFSAMRTFDDAPRYAALGTALAAMSPDHAEPIMRRIVRRVRHPVLVGQIMWGLGKGELRTRMGEHFVDVLDEAEAGLNLGEAESLTRLTLSCERYEDAKRCARVVISICDAHPKAALQAWRREAEKHIKAAEQEAPPPERLEMSSSGDSPRTAIENQLVDELAKVFPTPDLARLVVYRAELPSGLIPSFEKPIVFWHDVVGLARNGATRAGGGVQALVISALEHFPNNEVFLSYR